MWQQEGIPVRDISVETGLSMPTLTGMLDRMQASGMVERKADPEDRRKLKIMLTDKAKALEKEYKSISEDMNEIFLKGFTEKEVIELQNYLERILVNLQSAEQDL